MKKDKLVIIGCVIFGMSAHCMAAGKIINCPVLNAKQYGKTTYYDPDSGHIWNLSWQNKQTPVWNNTSIPQSRVCGVGKTKNGIPITYQCAIFQCKSKAVVASLGQNQAFKCFSAYVSTQNTFYCDGFSTS